MKKQVRLNFKSTFKTVYTVKHAISKTPGRILSGHVQKEGVVQGTVKLNIFKGMIVIKPKMTEQVVMFEKKKPLGTFFFINISQKDKVCVVSDL